MSKWSAVTDYREFMKMTDSELQQAIRSEGPSRGPAIAQLRALLVRGVSKSLGGRYGQRISAEDIVQESLTKILNSLDQFQGKSKFTTWAMTIAIRIGISELRRKYHAEQSLEAFSTADGGRMEVAAKDLSSPEKIQSRVELGQLLQQLIDFQLTDKQRIVVRGYLSEFSTDGIAHAMGMNRNAVYKLLHDARLRLKAGFENAGYSASDVLSILETGVAS
jgi:RNA polymerase sigma factor (sigma-70 family)